MTAPKRLTDQEEALRRQVHPNHIKSDGTVSSVAFTPVAAHGGMLSTLRGRVAPDEAHRRHTEEFQRESVGTWAVTVGEVDGVQVNAAGSALSLQALDDEDQLGVADHASVDFTQMTAAPTAGPLKQAARKLAAHANDRGRLHP